MTRMLERYTRPILERRIVLDVSICLQTVLETAN
jgi:hypothetical protein